MFLHRVGGKQELLEVREDHSDHSDQVHPEWIGDIIITYAHTECMI